MYQIDFNKPQTIHFIGIGGISMSGLAQVLLGAGFAICGSDISESPLTVQLEEAGAKVFYGQRAGNIEEGIDVVVYTAAVKKDNPEYQEVVSRGIPMITRAELLGQMMKNYKSSIAVAGTHGKTTTTSMMAEVLMEAKKDPTISVGGILPSIGGNIKVGKREVFVTEACEYTDSFLSFYPNIAIVLNIEEDHLDYFKDIHHIRDSFHKFGGNILPDGIMVINGDIEGFDTVVKDLDCKIITFGEGAHCDYQAKNIQYDEFGRGCFDLMKDGLVLGRYELGVQGKHNVLNALSVIAVADYFEIEKDVIQTGLLNYTGTNRRFQRKGELGEIVIIDDYAHHPQEIKVTIEAARNYPHKRIVCVFQPHTYTRTKAFLDEFAETLALADSVILTDIYPARETDTLGVSSKDLVALIEKIGTPVHYFSSFDDVETFILENCINGDLLITMGAGDVVKIGEKLLGQ